MLVDKKTGRELKRGDCIRIKDRKGRWKRYEIEDPEPLHPYMVHVKDCSGDTAVYLSVPIVELNLIRWA